MAVSHQSPKQQRGEGFRRISETPPGLTVDHDDPVFHGSNAPVKRSGMTKESAMKAPTGRRRGYKEPID